jgi:hypothetical protein
VEHSEAANGSDRSRERSPSIEEGAAFVPLAPMSAPGSALRVLAATLLARRRPTDKTTSTARECITSVAGVIVAVKAECYGSR